MLSLFSALGLALASGSDTVRVDLNQPVSPLRVGKSVVARVTNAPPTWMVQTSIRLAPAPKVDLSDLPSASPLKADPVSPSNPPVQGDGGKSLPTPKCPDFDTTGSYDDIRTRADKVLNSKAKDCPEYILAQDFVKTSEAYITLLNGLQAEVLKLSSPSAVAGLMQKSRFSQDKMGKWSRTLASKLDTLEARIQFATTRNVELELAANDTAVITAFDPASKDDQRKPISVSLIHLRKFVSMKGVSVGLGWYSHPVNNFTVTHSPSKDSASKTLSTIYNNPEDLGGSIQPSLVVFLPLHEFASSELGLTFNLSPKIDLANFRIFDASLSAGLAWASYPFGIQFAAGVTPLAHLKGNYSVGSTYEGDLEAATVTQNTFNVMFGGGVFWKAF